MGGNAEAGNARDEVQVAADPCQAWGLLTPRGAPTPQPQGTRGLSPGEQPPHRDTAVPLVRVCWSRDWDLNAATLSLHREQSSCQARAMATLHRRRHGRGQRG